MLKKLLTATTIVVLDFVLLIAIAIGTTYHTYYSRQTPNKVDGITQELCDRFDPEYFRWQVSPERWERNQEMIQSFNWSESCVNYIKYPVAKAAENSAL